MRLEPRTPGLRVKHLTTEPRGTPLTHERFHNSYTFSRLALTTRPSRRLHRKQRRLCSRNMYLWRLVESQFRKCSSLYNKYYDEKETPGKYLTYEDNFKGYNLIKYYLFISFIKFHL